MTLFWSPPIEISEEERWLLSVSKKAKLFAFLRTHRHRLFTQEFQQELAAMYPSRTAGKEPIPPALLAMATLLQAALGVSDEDAVELAVTERRWQMLLGCLNERKAPFSQGTLFNFRQRLIAHQMDRRLLERTVELARQTGGFSHKALRAAFDASPLFGAGRVEDTFNLIGHAAKDVLRTVATRLGVELEEAAMQCGIELVTGSSIKAQLDIDWDEPAQKKEALQRLVGQVRSLLTFVERELSQELHKPPLVEQVQTLRQVMEQDLEPDPQGGGIRIKQGVAKDRRISVVDAQMRHGRKSKRVRVDGYKRHLAVDIETDLIVAAAITPANRPEAESLPDLLQDTRGQGFGLKEVYVDRAFVLAPEMEAERARGTPVHCKALSLQNGGRFTKADFQLDWEAGQIVCPAGQRAPVVAGRTARFAARACQSCPLQAQCTGAPSRGRSVSIHPQESVLQELRARQRTPQGRAQLRKRTAVEHGLAAVGRSQGRRARYVGQRKNLFDLRRHASVHNLHIAASVA